jgi:large subunit ribosomal protein L23
MDLQQVIIEPVLTEKTNVLREGEQKKYVFRVHPWANKNMVARAMKELFDVKPVKCNIVNVKSKPRQTRTKHGIRRGATTSWKKAIVTLASGDKIEAIDGA